MNTKLIATSLILVILTACAPAPAGLTSPAETAAAETQTAAPTWTPTETATPSPTPTPTATPPGQGGSTMIAFTSNRTGLYQIYGIGLDNRELTQIGDSNTNDFFPEFSRDGDLFLIWATDVNANPPYTKLLFLNKDGSTDNFGNGIAPAGWAPDSGGLVFTTWGAEEGSGTDIGLVYFGEGILHRLTTDSADDLQPDWSPDGNTIVFTSLRDGRGQLYMMDVDGENQERFITGTSNGFLADWSPDGSQIAFVSGDDFSTQIYVINADGSGLVQLTDSQGYNEDPAWSPDGTMIAFWSSRTGNHEIFIMNADGTDPVNITNHPAADENPSWLPLR